MFGSALRGIGEDIDILVVGPGGEALLQLKRELQAAGEFLPLHILYMLPSEERRTDFVAREKCVPTRASDGCRQELISRVHLIAWSLLVSLACHPFE